MRSISLAETIYGRVTDLNRDPPQFWYFTEHKLHGDIGDALFMLSSATGRPTAELVSRLRRAVESQTSNRARSKAIAAGRLATVLYGQDMRDEADAYSEIALDLSTVVQSARLDAVLTEMNRSKQ